MVSWKIDRRSSIIGLRFWLGIILLIVVIVLCGAAIGILISNSKTRPATENDAVKDVGAEVIDDDVYEDIADESAPVDPEITYINFQPLLDSWANSVGGKKSVIVYDLERDEIVGEYNLQQNYATASLYKLFVVYEGYKRVASGEWSADAPAGRTGYTVSQCLDLAIRESNSECGETLWSMIGRAELDEIIIADYHILNSDISSLVSCPFDILEIMKRFYSHSDIDNEVLISQMKDSFLNQPTTIYNWRQGLPSGFSNAVNVYNKVGWEYEPEKKIWNIYHDAAIVEFPAKNRHFIVVVMSNFIPFQSIRNLGTMIEAEFNKY